MKGHVQTIPGSSLTIFVYAGTEGCLLECECYEDAEDAKVHHVVKIHIRKQEVVALRFVDDGKKVKLESFNVEHHRPPFKDVGLEVLLTNFISICETLFRNYNHVAAPKFAMASLFVKKLLDGVAITGDLTTYFAAMKTKHVSRTKAALIKIVKEQRDMLQHQLEHLRGSIGAQLAKENFRAVRARYARESLALQAEIKELNAALSRMQT
jgi:hypothetical protein